MRFYRYDLLCLEGISRALNIFLGKCPAPAYRTLSAPKELNLEMHVSEEVGAL